MIFIEATFTPDKIGGKNGIELKLGSNISLTSLLHNKLSKKYKPLNTQSMQINPCTLDLAILSKLSYHDYDFISNKLESLDYNWRGEYEILCCAKKGSYHASLFFHEGNSERPRQLIIAHRGTEGLTDYPDWYTNLHGIVKNEFTGQINSACTFTLHVLETVFKYGHSIQIIFTGHSLGGWLAQISTYAAKYLKIVQGECGDGEDTFCRLEGSMERCHPHCKVFDSPGAYQILYGISKELPAVGQVGHFPICLDISNFILLPNMINVINHPFGEMIQVVPSPRLKIEPTLVGKLIRKVTSRRVADTLTFHEINNFIKALDPMVNPIFKLERITVWPNVIFENYNTKTKYVLPPGPLSTFIKLLNVGVDDLWSKSAMKQFSQWFQVHSKNFKSELGDCSVLDVTLSETERGLVDNVRQVGQWLVYFSSKQNNLKTLHLQELEELSQIGDFTKVQLSRGRITFPCENVLKMIKNYALANKQIPQVPDYYVVSLICKSQRYINELKNAFWTKVKLEGNLSFLSCPSQNVVIVHKDEAYLKLLLLKVVTDLENEGENQVLVLKYDALTDIFRDDPPNWPPQSKGFFTIILNFIDYNGTVNTENVVIQNFRHIWFMKEKNQSNVQKDYFDNLGISQESLKDLLQEQFIQLQNQSVSLAQIIPQESDQLLEFLKFLNNNPSSLLQILDKRAVLDLQIGKLPKSLFEFENTYLKVGSNFENEEELKSYFNANCFSRLAVVFSDESDFALKKLLGPIMPMGYIVIKNDANYFLCFQEICKANEDLFVDLIFYKKPSSNMKEGQFQHRFQYNPKSYVDRIIFPPVLELHDLCNSIINKTNLKIKIGEKNNSSWVVPDTRSLIDFNVETNITLHKHYVEEVVNFMNLPEWQNISCHDGTRFVTFFCVGNQHKQLNMQFGPNKQICNLKNRSIPESITEEEVMQEIIGKRNLLILSDEPGMGKSRTIVNLANKIFSCRDDNNVKKPTLSLLIEAKNIDMDILEEMSYMESFTTLISTYFQYDTLSQNLLPMIISGGKVDVFLFVDGFDEMVESRKPGFANLLKELRVHTTIKIIVSTRPRDSELLEQSLVTMSHHFEEIRDKVGFLERWWTGYMNVTLDTSNLTGKRKKIREFSELVVSRAQTYLDKDKNRVRFLGVPLQLKMLSEVFLQNVKIFSQSDSQAVPTLEGFNLLKIYEIYIQKKYEIYLLQKLGQTESAWRKLQGPLTSYYDTHVTLMAGKVLEMGIDFDYLVSYFAGRHAERCDPEIFSIGILSPPNRKSDSAQFPHLTFAEFYVAKFLFGLMKEFFIPETAVQSDIEIRQRLSSILKNSIFTEKGWVMATFLDSLIDRDEVFIRNIKQNNILHPNGVQQVSNDKLDLLIREWRFPFLLGLTLNIFNIDQHRVVKLLQKMDLSFSIFYLPEFEPISTLLVLLQYLQQKFELRLESLKLFRYLILDRHMKPIIAHFRREKVATFFYSINDAKNLVTKAISELGGVTRDEFIYMKPLAALIFYESKDESWEFLNQWKTIVSSWGGEFSDFPISLPVLEFQRLSQNYKCLIENSKLKEMFKSVHNEHFSDSPMTNNLSKILEHERDMVLLWSKFF